MRLATSQNHVPVEEPPRHTSDASTLYMKVLSKSGNLRIGGPIRLA